MYQSTQHRTENFRFNITKHDQNLSTGTIQPVPAAVLNRRYSYSLSFRSSPSGLALPVNQDAILFAFTPSGGEITHVGIYIGGGRFIHAANPRKGVIISSLSESYYNARYFGANRIIFE